MWRPVKRKTREFLGAPPRPVKECEDCGKPKSSCMGRRCSRCSQEVHNIRMSEKHKAQRQQRKSA